MSATQPDDRRRYAVNWDNGGEACGTFPDRFDTEEEAQAFADNWANDRNLEDGKTPEDVEECGGEACYTAEVIEVTDCGYCGKDAGDDWLTTPDQYQEAACQHCIALFREAAAEGRQASTDAHGGLVAADAVYNFIRNLWYEDEDPRYESLPERMPHWFKAAYESPEGVTA